MKKIKSFFLVCIMGILLIFSGCSNYLKPQEVQTGTDVQHSNNIDVSKGGGPVNSRPSSLGGICLGDSLEDIINILGKECKESFETDESGYIGEDMIIWSFDKGITITSGKESKKVIRVVSHNKDFQTDQGIKVGDEAKTAFEIYKSKFEEVKSRHSDEVLDGWFHIENGQIIIFDYDRDNNSKINNNVKPSPSIQEIVLAYWKHFD